MSSIEKCEWIKKWCKMISQWDVNFHPLMLYRCGLFFNVSFENIRQIESHHKTLCQQWVVLMEKVWRDIGCDTFLNNWNLWLRHTNQTESYNNLLKLNQTEECFFESSAKIYTSQSQWKMICLVECLWFCLKKDISCNCLMSSMSTLEKLKKLTEDQKVETFFAEIPQVIIVVEYQLLNCFCVS